MGSSLGKLAFHSNAGVTTPYSSTPHLQPDLNSFSVSPIAPNFPQTMHITNAGDIFTGAQYRGKLNNTSQGMSLATTYPGSSLTHLSSSCTGAPSTFAPGIKQEVVGGYTEASRDISALTEGALSTSLSNVSVRAEDSPESVTEAGSQLVGELREITILNPSTSEPNLLQQSSVMEQQQVLDRSSGCNPQLTATTDSSNGEQYTSSTREGTLSSTVPRKPSSFMIDAILGTDKAQTPTSFHRSPSPGHSSLPKSDKLLATSSTSMKAEIGTVDINETAATSDQEPTSTTNGSVPAISSSGSGHAGSSSEELNVVDLTCSEEDSNHEHLDSVCDEEVKDDALSSRQDDSAEKVAVGALLHGGEPSRAGTPVSIRAASPNPSYLPQNYQISDSSIEDTLSKHTQPRSDVKDSCIANEHDKRATTADESNPNALKEESVLFSPFPCGKTHSTGSDENELNKNNLDSVFLLPRESTPSERQLGSKENDTKGKFTPPKPIPCSVTEFHSSTKSPSTKPRKLYTSLIHSPSQVTHNSPGKRKKTNCSENSTFKSPSTLRDSPSKRKCLEEIPENSQADTAPFYSPAESQNLEQRLCPNSREIGSSQRRRSRCLAFSSSSEDDVPKPRPKRPAPRKPRPKYTSTPLAPPTSQSRMQERTYEFHEILHICGNFFQRELSTVNTSASSSSPSKQPLHRSDSIGDQPSSTEQHPSLLAQSVTSADGLDPAGAILSSPLTKDTSLSRLPDEACTTEASNTTSPTRPNTSRNKTSSSADSKPDSGIASMLDSSSFSHENSLAFLESIKSKVMADPTYTMSQFRQDVLKFNRISTDKSSKTDSGDTKSVTHKSTDT